MSTPTDIYQQMLQRAQAEADSQAAAAQSEQRQAAEASLTNLTTALQQTVAGQKAIDERLSKIEQGIARPAQGSTAGQSGQSAFESYTGIPDSVVRPLAANVAREEAEKLFQEKMGPYLAEAEAIRAYGQKHEDFDLGQMQKYLAKNPEVQAYVAEAAQKGAFLTGIDYAETHRKLNEKIGKQAEGEVRRDKRKQFVENTRPDSQVVGASGSSNPAGLNVNPTPMTPEKLREVYARANAGDHQAFVDAFHKPNLPSEEEFQRLVQGPFMS